MPTVVASWTTPPPSAAFLGLVSEALPAVSPGTCMAPEVRVCLCENELGRGGVCHPQLQTDQRAHANRAADSLHLLSVSPAVGPTDRSGLQAEAGYACLRATHLPPTLQANSCVGGTIQKHATGENMGDCHRGLHWNTGWAGRLPRGRPTRPETRPVPTCPCPLEYLALEPLPFPADTKRAQRDTSLSVELLEGAAHGGCSWLHAASWEFSRKARNPDSGLKVSVCQKARPGFAPGA